MVLRLLAYHRPPATRQVLSSARSRYYCCNKDEASASSTPSAAFTAAAAAAPHKPNVRMAPFAMTSRHNSRALAGAGIVALGAGAYLCARAYNSRSRSALARADAAKSITVGGGLTLKEIRENKEILKSAEVPESKSPCEGCDCGMMEPGPLEGTMHAYERHVIICSGQDIWPKVIEAEESSLAESLFNMCLGAGLIWTKKAAKEAEANKQGVPKNRVKISACTEPSRGREGTTDVIIYPEGLIYSLSRDDMSSLEQFVKVQLVDGQVASRLRPVPVSYQKMVLVCTHMSRDKRCGRAGPQVLEEMAKELESRGVGGDKIALRGSSHFGGHRFAGVLIIYPQGDWYGLVNKNNAAAIIEKCVLGTEGMKANWRGNMANPGTKAEPVAKPAPVVKVAKITPEQEPKPAAIDEALGKVQHENGSGDGA